MEGRSIEMSTPTERETEVEQLVTRDELERAAQEWLTSR